MTQFHCFRHFRQRGQWQAATSLSPATGFQPILPFRGVRTFSNVDDGAMARKLDFFRRFEAGELTVAYTNEWSRLVNTPSSESEPATDEGGWSTDEEDEESEED